MSRFDQQARAYRESMAPILHAPGRRLLQEFEERQRATVLEVGTGVGNLLPPIQATFQGASVLGCDRSHGMLAVKPAGTHAAVMDATRLAIADGSVDLLLSVFMLFFLDEPLQGLREAQRVLRFGGEIGTVTWGTELEGQALSIWTECLDEHDPGFSGYDTARDQAVNTPAKMEDLLRQAGFREVRAWTEEHAVTIGLEHLIRMKTTVGREMRRFEGLEPAAREACVAGARRRLEALDRGAFVARAQVVYAAAVA